jgi:hypothetical protein
MAAKFEDLVQALDQAESVFTLGDDFPIFQQGMADLLARLRTLEAAQKAPEPANG